MVSPKPPKEGDTLVEKLLAGIADDPVLGLIVVFFVLLAAGFLVAGLLVVF